MSNDIPSDDDDQQQTQKSLDQSLTDPPYRPMVRWQQRPMSLTGPVYDAFCAKLDAFAANYSSVLPVGYPQTNFRSLKDQWLLVRGFWNGTQDSEPEGFVHSTDTGFAKVFCYAHAGRGLATILALADALASEFRKGATFGGVVISEMPLVQGPVSDGNKPVCVPLTITWKALTTEEESDSSDCSVSATLDIYHGFRAKVAAFAARQSPEIAVSYPEERFKIPPSKVWLSIEAMLVSSSNLSLDGGTGDVRYGCFGLICHQRKEEDVTPIQTLVDGIVAEFPAGSTFGGVVTTKAPSVKSLISHRGEFLMGVTIDWQGTQIVL